MATILAQIACHQNALPQGSPCSPIISNLIGNVLDLHLCKLASNNGCTYSRYADDITFSTNKRTFPASIAQHVDGEAHKWRIGPDLREVITRAGFAINPQKTRMQYRDSRQVVTGLVVNSKVNIRNEYRRTVRAMAHRLFMTGHFEHIQPTIDASGAHVPNKVQGTMAQLHGMLGHINRVDRHNAEIESKRESGEAPRKIALGAKEHLYRRFLMFKEFYSAPAPVIICEGKTDIVYLNHAIRSLASAHPSLATILPRNKITFNCRIFKYPHTSTGRILQLNGGAGDLRNFVSEYVEEMKRFAAPGKQHPVILLIDNDEGAKSIYNTVRQITKRNVSPTEPFVHIAEHLYLVPTPLREGGGTSVIEDSFTDQIRNLRIGGKTFSSNGDFDTAAHFGKHKLSKWVADNSAKIDFSGFAEICARLVAVIEAHRAKCATTPAAT